MRKRAVAHLKGNIWLWIGGIAVAGALAIMLDFGTVGAFLLMLVGILVIMADAHIDPLAVVTEDALDTDDEDEAGMNRPPGAGPQVT
jgi:hypothetical protein